MTIVNKGIQKSSASREQSLVFPENKGNNNEKKQQQQHHGRSIMKSLIIILALLTILVTPQVASEQSVLATKLKDPNIIEHVGSFVQPPLNTTQADAMSHLIDHMSYKQ